jgi:hypothetical protein
MTNPTAPAISRDGIGFFRKSDIRFVLCVSRYQATDICCVVRQLVDLVLLALNSPLATETTRRANPSCREFEVLLVIVRMKSHWGNSCPIDREGFAVMSKRAPASPTPRQ